MVQIIKEIVGWHIPDKTYAKYFVLRFKFLLSIKNHSVQSINYCHFSLAVVYQPAVEDYIPTFEYLWICSAKISWVSLHNLNKCFILTQFIFPQMVEEMLINTPLHINMRRPSI